MRLREISDVTRFWSIISDIKIELDNDYREILSVYQEIANFDYTSRVQYVIKCEDKLIKLIDNLINNIDIFDEHFSQDPFNEYEEIDKHRKMKESLFKIKNNLD